MSENWISRATVETVLLYGSTALDTDTVSRQQVGRGIYKIAESGEECDLAAVHYKRVALCRVT